MPRRFFQVVVMIVSFAAVAAHAGKMIDAVLVTVNHSPLLQSDLDEAIRFDAFQQQRPPDAMVFQQVVLERLIDQELLRQQMQGGAVTNEAEISGRVAELRAQFKGAETEAGWNAVLAQYGLTDAIVRDRVKDQLQILHFVDMRLRPTVRVDADAVAVYYRDVLVPKLRQMHAGVEPLETLAPKIQELLIQQKIETQLTAWLANLRAQSTIHVTHPSVPVVSIQTFPKVVPQQTELGAR